jgi:2-C-methyl-D-erythritol 4-phosphate cytidylyltransferase
LTDDSLDRLLQQGLDSDQGAILAVPVSDTLKREGENHRIKGTVDRTGLWAAQTPQLFPIDELIMNLESAISFGPMPTDEAEAMERSGRNPILVQGSVANIKITSPEDLLLAEFILTQRQKQHDQLENNGE